jgi:hypothetical protein
MLTRELGPLLLHAKLGLHPLRYPVQRLRLLQALCERRCQEHRLPFLPQAHRSQDINWSKTHTTIFLIYFFFPCTVSSARCVGLVRARPPHISPVPPPSLRIASFHIQVRHSIVTTPHSLNACACTVLTDPLTRKWPQLIIEVPTTA